MQDLKDIKPQLIRKYTYEYALLALCGCVVYLFVLYTNLNGYIRDNLLQSNAKQSEVISTNTKTMERIENALNRLIK